MYYYLLQLAPITKSVEKTNFSFFSTFFQIVFLLIVFVGILFLTYFSTKLIAKSKMASVNGSNIKIIETRQLGINSNVALINVCNQYFLVSISKEGVKFLSEVNCSEDEIKSIDSKNQIHFEEFLKNTFNKKNKKQ